MQLNTFGVRVQEQKPSLLSCHGRVLYLPVKFMFVGHSSKLVSRYRSCWIFMWLDKCYWEDKLFLLKKKEELLCFTQNCLSICFHCGAVAGRDGQNE